MQVRSSISLRPRTHEDPQPIHAIRNPSRLLRSNRQYNLPYRADVEIVSGCSKRTAAPRLVYLIHLVSLVYSVVVWINQTHETDRTDQMIKTAEGLFST